MAETYGSAMAFTKLKSCLENVSEDAMLDLASKHGPPFSGIGVVIVDEGEHASMRCLNEIPSTRHRITSIV